MSGSGNYTWSTQYNNTFAMPVMTVYRGDFERDKRHGDGYLEFGFLWGAHYRGKFKNNKKDGLGKLITNNGLIIQEQYHSDIIRPINTPKEQEDRVNELEPFYFKISDINAGMRYHVETAYESLDRGDETRAAIINEYIENNRHIEKDISQKKMILEEVVLIDSQYDQETIDFEAKILCYVVKSYEENLIKIYTHYTEICKYEPVPFRTQLIRLFLWKFYWDCNIHAKGLTLVDIDDIFLSKPVWRSKTPHNPFKRIYFWQFVHNVIAVASKLYARKVLPGPKPDTIVATAFRKFMEEDVLVGCQQPRWGKLLIITNRYHLM